MIETGRFANARASAEAIAPDAIAVAYPPVIAELAFKRVLPEEALGSLQRAVEFADDALLLARASGHRHLAAEITIHQLFLRGYLLDDHHDEQDLLDAAEHRVRAAGNPDLLVARLAGVRAILEGTRGNHVTSLEWLEIGVTTIARVLDELNPEHITMIGNMALANALLGDQHAALNLRHRALSLAESSLGSMHPSLAWHHGNLAVSLMHDGQLRPALDHAQAAARLCAQLSDQRPAQCGQELLTVARLGQRLGDLNAAQSALDELQAWQEASGVRGYPEVPWAGVRRAQLSMQRSEHASALQLARSALAQTLADATAIADLRAEALLTLAQAELQGGAPRRSLELLAQARPLVDSSARNLGNIRQLYRLVHGRASLDLGDLPAALKHFQQALALAADSHGDPKFNAAQCHRDLAIVMAKIGRPSAALEHATLATQLQASRDPVNG